jgi:hypothetical protein
VEFCRRRQQQRAAVAAAAMQPPQEHFVSIPPAANTASIALQRPQYFIDLDRQRQLTVVKTPAEEWQEARLIPPSLLALRPGVPLVMTAPPTDPTLGSAIASRNLTVEDEIPEAFATTTQESVQAVQEAASSPDQPQPPQGFTISQYYPTPTPEQASAPVATPQGSTPSRVEQSQVDEQATAGRHSLFDSVED